MGKQPRLLSALLCAALFLLSGCSSPSAGDETSGPGNSPEQQNLALQSGSEATGNIVVSISRDAPRTLVEAAEYFCGEYERVTGKSAELLRAIAPDADLLSGRAQVALLNKKRQLEFNLPLAATATPFSYSGYHSFTMRANASSTMELLETSLRGQQSGLVPLAAYYQGSRHLLADFSVSSYQSFELIYFGISDDAEMKATAERLLSVPVVADTDDERMALYHAEEANVTEVSLEVIARQEGFERPTYMVASYHNLVPVWMLCRADFYDGLSPRQRAELAECAAHMTNLIDNAYLAVEEESKAALGQIGNLLVTSELSFLRNRVFNTLPVPGSSAGAQRRLARDLIDMMRRIA